jgi:hypothetical protein
MNLSRPDQWRKRTYGCERHHKITVQYTNDTCRLYLLYLLYTDRLRTKKILDFGKAEGE